MTARRNRRSLGTVLLNAPYLLWAALFIIIPLFIVLYYACTDGEGHFTLSNFAYLKDYGSVMLRSFWYSLAATAICLLIAYPYAYIVCRFRPAGQRFANLFIMLPMWINLLIRTYCLTTLMEGNGLINQFLAFLGFGKLPLLNNTGAVIFGMVYNYLPYMILPLHTTLVSIDHSYIEAAEDLGADKMTVFLKTILPLSVSGIVSGITMTFIPAISTFAISEILSSSKIFLFGDAINMHFSKTTNSFGVGSVMSLVMLIIVILSNVVVNLTSKDEEVKSTL